jgi:hypothetical protein
MYGRAFPLVILGDKQRKQSLKRLGRKKMSLSLLIHQEFVVLPQCAWQMIPP